MTTLNSDRLHHLVENSGSRSELAQHLRRLAHQGLNVREMRTAIKMLKGFPESATTLKVAVLGSYTIMPLKEYWILHGLFHGFELDLYFAPYGQVMQELHPGSQLSEHKPDFTYLLLQWSDIVPALAEPLHAFDEQERKRLIDLFASGLEELVTTAQRAGTGTLALSFLPNLRPSGLGLYDVMSEYSESMFRLQLREHVTELLHEQFPSVCFDDGDHLLSAQVGGDLFDPRLWYTSHFPFSIKGANLFVQRLFRFPVLLRTPKVKCIVLDCDGTLWGGVIGEDGMEGIALGADYPGSCFVDFQRRLLDFLHRGILLAICSKNDLSEVRRVLFEHPHMVLREDQFAAVRANWNPKPDNICSIAEELRLGLDSFLFVDDSPFECRMMCSYVPEVRVVQIPERVMEVPTCLDHLQELEILSFTAEDRARSKMYIQNRKRHELAVACRDMSEYLASLQMRMQIVKNGKDRITRLAQMTQKTNQFNLTTRRYNETDILSFIDDPDWLVAFFSLSDIFGDNGIVGLALISGMTTTVVEIDTFLLSCRVIGRQAEEAFLYRILSFLRGLGKTAVIGSYIPTAKNSLVQGFWEQQGFSATGQRTFEFSLEDLPAGHPSLEHFQIQFEG